MSVLSWIIIIGCILRSLIYVYEKSTGERDTFDFDDTEQEFEPEIEFDKRAYRIDSFPIYLVTGVEKQLKNDVALSYICMDKGLQEYNAGNYEDSVYYFIPSILLNPNDPEGYRNVGVAKIMLHEYNEALFYLDNAIDKFPNDSELYSSRALLYLSINDFEKSQENTNIALMLDPNNAEAYYVKGCLNYINQEYEKCIQDYSKAISLGDNHVKECSYFEMADFYHKIHCFQNVDLCIEEITKINPNKSKSEIMNKLTELNLQNI